MSPLQFTAKLYLRGSSLPREDETDDLEQARRWLAEAKAGEIYANPSGRLVAVKLAKATES